MSRRSAKWVSCFWSYMEFNRKGDIKVFNIKNKIKYENGLIPLSWYIPHRNYPVLYRGAIHNSKEAELFHQKMKVKSGIICKASILRGICDDTHMSACLDIMIEDNEISDNILEHKSYKYIYCDNEFFHVTIGALLDALKETNKDAYSILSKLYAEEKLRYASGKLGTVHLSIAASSFSRTFMNEIYGESSIRINKMFDEKFSQYKNLECCCYSISEYDTFADHLFLFFTPDDLEKAKSSGDLDKMISEAYAIVKETDTIGLFTEELYRAKLQIDSRRNFTQSELFYILRGK